jgi:hypothetical protein
MSTKEFILFPKLPRESKYPLPSNPTGRQLLATRDTSGTSSSLTQMALSNENKIIANLESSAGQSMGDGR